MANGSASWAPVYPITAGYAVHRQAFCPVGMLLLRPWPSEVCVAISFEPPRKDEGNGTFVFSTASPKLGNGTQEKQESQYVEAITPGSEAASVESLVPHGLQFCM